VLLPKADREKFRSRCALMLFVHYANDHPLYTYAVYSPLTKKVLMRQDCIFLPKLFPMRIARSSVGMNPDGEPLIPMRSPLGIREGGDPELSFEAWQESDPLPEYVDHVRGSRLIHPRDRKLVQDNPEVIDGRVPDHRPFHPSFGAKSVVVVHKPPGFGISTNIDQPTGASLVEMESVGLSSDNPPQGSTTPVAHGASVAQPTQTFFEAYRGGTGPVDFRFLPQPPSDHRMFHSSGPRGAAFTIRLVFSGIVRATQNYRVYETMPVRVLHYRIAFHVVIVDPRGIHLFVEGRVLFHSGTISDRFDPRNPTVPTPFLVPNSVLEVRLVPIGTFGPAPVRLPLVAPELDIGVSDVLTIPPPPPGLDGHAEIVEDNAMIEEDIAVSDSTTGECDAQDEQDPAIAVNPTRRISTRVRAQRSDRVPAPSLPGPMPPGRRRARDRWYYAPLEGQAQESSSAQLPWGDDQESSSVDKRSWSNW
jgi:hypothetical protein